MPNIIAKDNRARGRFRQTEPIEPIKERPIGFHCLRFLQDQISVCHTICIVMLDEDDHAQPYSHPMHKHAKPALLAQNSVGVLGPKRLSDALSRRKLPICSGHP